MPPSSSLNAKIKFIPIFIALGLLIIGSRLFYLQIKQREPLFAQSQKNFLRIEKIQSPRGNILDRSGILLATNRPLTNLLWQGRGNATFSERQKEILQKISLIIDKPLLLDPALYDLLLRAEKKQKKIVLACDLSFEQLSQIQEQFAADENVVIANHFKRYYPYQSFACHVLGYLGSLDFEPQGKMGLEKMFEDILKGEPGTALKKINSVGRSLDEIEVKEALAGKNLQTTIDIDLQNICEQIFPPDQAGTFILMDPADGALVAMVSRPNFDPNIFLGPITSEQWQELQDKQPFLNRAFNACYAPGSIFKLVTVSAALELGLTTPNATTFCPGYLVFADSRRWCAHTQGHGRLTTGQAVAQSCNILFYEIGKKISIDTLAQYAHKFGLGEKTNTCFPEKEGLIPSAQWKLKTKGERWRPGETLSAAIGQSYLLVTPIQVACLISSIFTGYLVSPRILQDEPINKRPLAIQKTTLEFLKESMRAVVTKGTGIRVSQVKAIEIYAKTSTAQVCSLGKESNDNRYLEHGWFVTYFKYKNNRPLTAIILAEHVGTSRVSAGYAKNFLVEYKKLMDYRENPIKENSSIENIEEK